MAESDVASMRGEDESLSKLAAMLRVDERFRSDQVSEPSPGLLLIRRSERSVLLVDAVALDEEPQLLEPHLAAAAGGSAAIVALGQPSRGGDALNLLFAMLPARASVDAIARTARVAFEHLDLRARVEAGGRGLQRYRYELGELVAIARVLTTERDVDRLLTTILEKARFITGADAGSIYVVEGDDPDPRRRLLRFKFSQNDSIRYESSEFVLPISHASITGSVACSRQLLSIEDVYDLGPTAPYRFDRSFDERMGYRSRSMLVAPMVSTKGELLGVVQLINRKRVPSRKLRTSEDFAQEVLPFDQRSGELLTTLAAQAAIALENALLYDEINRIFAGFVTASVEAIEQRDPTTSGHSRRVATLTVALAEVVNRADSGPFADARFTVEELREIEVASLLHDFGKIGVREQVLVKAKKLLDWQLAALRQRFDYARMTREVELLRRRCELLERGVAASECAAMERELESYRAQLEAGWSLILAANEPTVLRGEDFQALEALARQTFMGPMGVPMPLLCDDELDALRIRRGSLSTVEIEEIRSHVVHTRNFLRRIPWGRAFRRVPLIAGCHHEKLNGTGYPGRLASDEIPLQSKLMSIADIFDALTAHDRPYKRAVPLERALDILGYEVRDGALDGELVRLFIDGRVWSQLDIEPNSAPRSRIRLT